MEKKASFRRNSAKAPDLLKNVNLSKEDDKLLQEFIVEHKESQNE